MDNLSDAATRISRAGRLWNELVDVIKPWLDSGGIVVQLHPDPDLAQDIWYIAKVSEPEQSIEVLCADILGNLRSALDMIAWQIYLQGGGDSDSKAGKGIYFPIVEDSTKWEKELKSKAPTAWPEAVDALLASQPFAQPEEARSALPVLHGMNNPDKHRQLSLVAISDLNISGVFPDLGGDDTLSYTIVVPRPGPKIEYMIGNEFGRIAILRQASGSDQATPVPRSAAPAMTTPPPPEYLLAVRNGDFEMNIQAIPSMMTHIREIFDRFKAVVGPTS